MLMRGAWRDALVYTLSQGLYHGVPILMVPVYSRMIAPREFGVLELFLVVGTIVSLVASLEISQGLARFYVAAADAASRRALASSAFWFTAAGCALFLAVSIAWSPAIAKAITGDSAWAGEYRLAALAMALHCLFIVVQSQLRWRFRPVAFAATSLVHAGVNVATTVFCLFALRLGFASVLIGQGLAASIAGAVAWWMSRESFGWTFSSRACRLMLAFSLPLVPSSIAVLCGQFLDRIALNHFRPLAEVGVYAVGHRVGSSVNILLVGLHSALTPLIYRDHALPSTPVALATLLRRFLALALTCVVALAVFARDLIAVAAPPQYHAAAWLVAPLAASTLISRLYIFAPGLEIAKRTGGIAWINLGALAVQGVAALLLVPAHGMRGAAIASLVGSLTGFGLALAASQRHYPVPHAYGRITLAALLALASAAASTIWRLPTAMAVAIAALAASMILFVLDPFPRLARPKAAR
jgi:O-antigen/teichoic acid export membrane protein